MHGRLRLSSPVTGVVASAVVVALVTGVVALLEPYVPTLSLGSLYVFAVLPVAALWGISLAVAVSVASMLAFNWFFLEPVHTFTLSDSSNWFALVVYVVTAVVVSELAARTRRRAKEAELLARIASSLLERGSVAEEMDEIASGAASALRVDRVRIDLAGRAAPGPGEVPLPLRAAGREIGTVYVSKERRGNTAARRRRVLDPLASMLAVAIDRERLAREAVEAEALRRSDMIKTAVLRAVSHDLRSPLMAISTSAETLARFGDALDDADRKGLLEAILLESARLDRLVADLLDLSRLQAGVVAPRRQACAVGDLVERAVEAVGAARDRVEVDPGVAPEVVVDPGQIERVLVNLIENALKYSPADAPVGISAAVEGTDLVIRVDDRGPGLSPEELERVFEPFERGAASTAVRGAGLGLAIARGFAEANGGRIRAAQRAGGGSSFTLTLPLVTSPTPVAA